MLQFPAGSLTSSLTASLTRDLVSGLTGRATLDPDAAAYIANLEGDGLSLSDAQKTAIDTFYVTGKDEGWYSEVARLYLPIWQQASSNARCLVSGTSGTFVGSVTHLPGAFLGFINSYFDTGDTAADKGLTTTVGGYGFLQKTAPSGSTQTPMGAHSTTDFVNYKGVISYYINPDLFFFYGDFTGSSPSGASTSDTAGSKIYSCWRSGSSLYLDDRTASGFNNKASFTHLDYSPASINDYILASNLSHPFGGGGAYPYSSQIGAAFYHKWTDSAYNEKFTLALKNLWETCTGLSLS